MRLRAAFLALLTAGLVSGANAAARPGPEASDIYAASVDGSQFRNLTRSRELDDAPVVSPDGRRIAFVRGIPPSVDIYVMNADGTKQEQRTGAGGEEREPAWGPDGKAFAFTYFEPGARSGAIRVLGWTRGDVRRPGARARFAPNGRTLVFQDAGGLATLSRAGGAAFRRVLRGRAADPVWSPKGLRIAFERDTSTGPFVWVMNADGSRVRRLGSGSDPDWSRRGLITFVRAGDIFSVRPDGRGLRQLTRGTAVDSLPVWSRDGTKVAFLRRAGPDPTHVYVVSARGTGLTWVSQQGGGVSAARPAWSPDGRFLYYAARLPIVPPRY